jgi:hypothetical protein
MCFGLSAFSLLIVGRDAESQSSAEFREEHLRAGSVCLNKQLTAAKWISARVMLQPGLAVAQ